MLTQCLMALLSLRHNAKWRSLFLWRKGTISGWKHIYLSLKLLDADHTDDERRQQQLSMNTPPANVMVVLETQRRRIDGLLLLVGIVVDRKYRSVDPPVKIRYTCCWTSSSSEGWTWVKSFVNVPEHDPEDLDFKLHGDSHFNKGFEGLENVRACCAGRHTGGWF